MPVNYFREECKSEIKKMVRTLIRISAWPSIGTFPYRLGDKKSQWE